MTFTWSIVAYPAAYLLCQTYITSTVQIPMASLLVCWSLRPLVHWKEEHRHMLSETQKKLHHRPQQQIQLQNYIDTSKHNKHVHNTQTHIYIHFFSLSLL